MDFKPELKDIKITTQLIDEWFGIQVEFQWEDGFDYKAFTRANEQEISNYFKENIKRIHIGPFPTEKALVDHVVKQIYESSAYTLFYSKNHVAYLEVDKEVVTIPQFKNQDFSDWDFYDRGGWIAASTRN